MAGGCIAEVGEPHEFEENVGEDDVADVDDLSSKYRSTANGLRTINGVTTTNGLRTLNGLTTSNGLRTINGITTMNGLRTFNGIRTVNGYRTINGVRTAATLNVDCSGGQTLNTNGTNAGTCTGKPDGLLSSQSGLMRSANGVMLAKYIVKCALPSTKSVRVLDYTGTLVNMPGELNLAPEWDVARSDANGRCDSACEQKVSACLLALTNGSGAHVGVEISSDDGLGTGHSSTNIYQEAAFYGNLFVSPPRGYVTPGLDYGRRSMARSCSVPPAPCPYSDATRCARWDPPTESEVCPYVYSGESTDCLWTAKDGRGRGTAVSCTAAGKSWPYAITTFRSTIDYGNANMIFRDDTGRIYYP